MISRKNTCFSVNFLWFLPTPLKSIEFITPFNNYLYLVKIVTMNIKCLNENVVYLPLFFETFWKIMNFGVKYNLLLISYQACILMEPL